MSLKIQEYGINMEEIFEEGLFHFRSLIKIDTSNPPGNEIPACKYISKVLAENGISSKIVESAPKRGNIFAKLYAKNKESFLLSGHLDVVPAIEEGWTHPPFAGIVDKGYVWGRGALDMKNMITYSLMSLLIIKRLKLPLKRNLIFACFADEENGSNYGANYIVKNYPDLIKVEFALNEVGGFTLYSGGKKLYPVQLANKGNLWIKIKAKGEGGHGSIPNPHSSIMKLLRGIEKIAKKNLGFKKTKTASEFLNELGDSVGGLRKIFLKLIQQKFLNKMLLKIMPDKKQSNYLYSILNNTVNPTMLQSGVRVNVIPEIAEATIDVRFLPGFSAKEIVEKITKTFKDDFEFEILNSCSGVEITEKTSLFEEICGVIKDMDEDAKVVPYILSGITDASHLKELGIKTIGFTPVKLSPEIDFFSLFHAKDERIPLDGFQWGLEAFLELVLRYCT